MLFDSIYSSSVTPGQFFIMAGAAIVTGLIYSFIMSFRIRSSKRFFLVTTLMPLMVATVITFVNGNIGAGVAIGGAFALDRKSTRLNSSHTDSSRMPSSA